MLDNDSKTFFNKIMAKIQPSVLLTKRMALIVSLKSNALIYTTSPTKFSLTKEKSLKNVNYQFAIKKSFARLCSSM